MLDVLQIVAVAQVEPETLADPERVFIAASLREALRVEELLTTVGVHYAVQVEPFTSGLFSSTRHGAVFYVERGQAAYCRSHLAAHGLRRVWFTIPTAMRSRRCVES